jgi:hypothetical protein
MQELFLENPPVKTLQRIASDRSALPLSYAQQRLWLLDQLDPGRTAYNIVDSVRIRVGKYIEPDNELERTVAAPFERANIRLAATRGTKESGIVSDHESTDYSTSLSVGSR